ncbi:glycosyltransferase family 4 protein [Methanobacterium oryzae]|uniref:glycosyltransferase family 4 protein n=1 Tax=Methanobacterium oryzae TaxID=69540 RepID=UPI003D212F84
MEINNTKDFPKKIKVIRRKKYFKSILIVQDMQLQPNLEILKLITLFSKAKNKKIVDLKGNQQEISWKTFLIKDLPTLVLIIPISLIYMLITVLFLKILSIRKKRNIKKIERIKSIAYLRTDHWFDLKAGGSVGHIAGVANAFYENHYNIFFISSDNLADIKDYIPIHIVKPSYRFVNLPEIPEIAYNYKFARKAKKLFHQNKPDIIYQRYSLNNFAGIILSRKFSVPLIIEYNGSFVWMSGKWGQNLKFPKIAKIIENANLFLSDLIVVVSKPMKDELISLGVPESKILVNPNGVDTVKYNQDIKSIPVRKKYSLENKIVVGFIGTFSQWHGVEIIAKSIKYIAKKHPNVRFLFIGDGPKMEEVIKIIKKDKMEDYVIFTGIVEQKRSATYLAACDILVSPTIPNPDGSTFFGSPTKIFEYMAMQKGIVASDIGQISEIIENNQNGILVKPGDQDDFNEGLMKLIKDEKLRKTLGKQARKDVFNYTWQKNIERVIKSLNKFKCE